MASLFAGSDSESDSDFDDDATIRSNETGGDSFFDDLSLASGDDLDVYGQGTGRHGDESDDELETSVARTTPRRGNSPGDDARDVPRRTQRRTSGVAAAGTTTTQFTHPDMSEDGLDDLEATSLPGPFQRSNNRPSKRSRSTPPAREGGEAEEPAATPHTTTTTTGEGDGLTPGGTGGSRVPAIGLPKGRSKETHNLHNNGKNVFISFDIETAGKHVGIVQIYGLPSVRRAHL